MAFLHSLRRRLADRIAPVSDEAPTSRRAFFRRAAGAAALGTGLLLPSEAFAEAQERAARFGITPGTVVDAQGRLIRRTPIATDPFLGEIMFIGFNFNPGGWALCQGQILSISTNSALFSLLGTTFGGDGETSFGLPNLQGRSPVGEGTGPGLSPIGWGEQGGSEQRTLSAANLPAHTHTMTGSSSAGTSEDPTGRVPAVPASSIPQYADSGAAAMDPTGSTGNNSSFNIRSPYLGLYVCIATLGVYPSESVR